MWHAFRVAFPLRSPLHVGWRTTGNLKQTRPYLIGRSFWGALTARVARDRLGGDYREADIQVRRNVVHTYFYPSVNPDRVDLWPWESDRDRFAWLHLDSFSSTALVDGRAKLDGSLHETELIAPVARDGSPVWLVGYVWCTDAGLELVSRERLTAARAYFTCVMEFNRSPMDWPGRQKHPSTDPLNALLSLTYTLLMHELTGLLEGAGLDPYLGFLNQVDQGRPSLALDLMEPFRHPVADRLVLTLVNRGVIGAEDFHGGGERAGVFLAPTAMKRYLAEYERWMLERPATGDAGGTRPRFRDLLKTEVEKLVAALREGRAFPPFRWQSPESGGPCNTSSVTI